MNIRRNLLVFVVAFISVASQVGCGSSIQTSTVPMQHVRTTHPASNLWTPRVFTGRPALRHEIIGSIELRTTRPATVARLFAHFVDAARAMHADAIIPPKGVPARSKLAEHAANPFAAYYLRDEAQGQLLEAVAIRFPRYVVGGHKRLYADSTQALSSLVTRARSIEGCVPVWIDLPRGPEIVGMFKDTGAEAPEWSDCNARDYGEPEY